MALPLRRLGIELEDKNEGTLLSLRRYRLAFDGTNEVHVLRSELERRLQSPGLKLFVKGADGIMWELFEGQTVDDAVASDEMIVAVKKATSRSSSTPAASRTTQPIITRPLNGSINTSMADNASATSGGSGDIWKGGATYFAATAAVSNGLNPVAPPFSHAIGEPGPSWPKFDPWGSDSIAPRLATATTAPSIGPSSETPPMSQFYAVTPLKQIYAVLHTYLKNSAASDRHKVVVFFPIYPAVVAAVQVLRSLGDVGTVYEARIRSRRVDESSLPAFEEFLDAPRGVLVTTGVIGGITGLTAIMQVGLPSTPQQYLERLQQPDVTDATSSLLILAQCEEGFVRKATMASISLSRHQIPSAPFQESQTIISRFMRERSMKVDVIEQLKAGLMSYWNGQGVNVSTYNNAKEISDFWQWYGVSS